jgi:uncharacterized protein (DUF2164 family)
MKPEEKAKELVEKFRRYISADEDLEYEYSKQCAIIAVEEVIEELSEHQYSNEIDISKDFWNEVKNEINNL